MTPRSTFSNSPSESNLTARPSWLATLDAAACLRLTAPTRFMSSTSSISPTGTFALEV
jgi:hypothetical protein